MQRRERSDSVKCVSFPLQFNWTVAYLYWRKCELNHHWQFVSSGSKIQINNFEIAQCEIKISWVLTLSDESDRNVLHQNSVLLTLQVPDRKFMLFYDIL